jgi:flagellar hook-length control protein FliK
MLTVEITPDELGPVRISVELREGNVELQLAGHSEAARDALRAALPELRRALEAAGIGTGTFNVAPDSQGQPQNGNGQPQTSGNPQNGHARPAWAGLEGRAPHHPEPDPTPVAGSGGSSLDLQL